MSDIKKLLEHIDAINALSSSKKQLNEAGWTPNEAQRKWLGGADINDPYIIARMPAKLGPKPGIPDLPPADQEIAKQYNRGVDTANKIRSFFGLKTGATQQSASTDQSTQTPPARSSSPTADTQPEPGTTRPGLRIPWQLPDNKVDIVPSKVKTQTGIRKQAVPIELNEIEMDESGLQAYLGNKKYGREGMDALRKAGRDGASKEKMAKIRAKYDKLDEQGVAEGLSLNSITAIGSFIPNFVQRAFAAGKIEAQDSAKFAQILGKWLGTGQISPQESDFAKEQFIDILKAIAGGALAYAAVAPMASAHAASGVASIINHAVEHTAADMTFEALAAVLAKKLGFNLPQKILHGLTTSGGRAAEKEHEHSPTNPQLDRYVDKKFQQAKTGFGGMTENRAVNRLTRKFENYLSNRFEMLESGYGSEKKKFKVEAAPAAPIYPNAQDPNAQTTSPQPSSAQATKDEQDKKREQQVDIATAKGTMSGLKNVLGPNLDINQAASAVTKINDGKPLTGPEQQAMSAITPLLAKAAEMPQTASNLKTSLTNAAYLAKLGK